MSLRHRLKNWRNPHNQTQLHLSRQAARHGWDIGEFSYGHPKVRFAGDGRRLAIGKFCSIGDRVEILLGGNHHSEWVTTYPFGALRDIWPEAKRWPAPDISRGDVTIGHDVWIGSDALILSGVTVGHGAVIGARTVVVHDVPPYAVVAGNPAKVVRFRFDEATVDALLSTRWWDLPRSDIVALVPLLQSENVAAVIEAVRAIRQR